MSIYKCSVPNIYHFVSVSITFRHKDFVAFSCFKWPTDTNKHIYVLIVYTRN